MSFSNPQAKNPATRFMQWRGGAEAFKDEKTGKVKHEGGRVTWYDKENQTDVEVPLPFSFIVLDSLHTITGFSESDHSGFWSNEVRDLKNEMLVVRTKSGIKARGTYDQIKDEIKAQGAKYTQSVYIAYKDESGELAIGHIKIAGSALTSWIEFQKKFDIEQCAVFITDEPKLEKKGSNYYFSPVFEGQNISDSTRKEVIALDEQLQKYLNTYLARKPDTTEPVADDNDDDDTPEIEDADGPVTLPADDDEPGEDEAEAPAAPAPKAPAPKKNDDKKINLADVPF